ncbi:kinase-like domain-containing protein, partial [Blyttiomyces helicus]
MANLQPQLLSPDAPMSPRSRRNSGVDAQIKETLNARLTDHDGARRLNQYLIKTVLGRGSFGTVYLAVDMDLNEPVAVKEFSKSKLRREKLLKAGAFGARGRFRGRGGSNLASRSLAPENPIELVRSEIAILKKLSHPNVVKLYEVLDDPESDSLYMVFELCEKGAVLTVSADAVAPPLAPDDARAKFRQM